MFRQLDSVVDTEKIRIKIDGVMFEVPNNINVAEAICLSTSGRTRKTRANKKSRGPYCMMGVCYECLTMIDGAPNQQSCTKKVHDNMIIITQTEDDNETL